MTNRANSVEALVATMNQTDFSLLEKISLQSGAVIINQCDHDRVFRFSYHGHPVIWIDSKDRGVAKSRNLALIHSSADICVLVDGDETLRDGYPEMLLDAFNQNPKMDIGVFNIESINGIRKRFTIRTEKRLYKTEILRYGAARVAFFRSSIVKKGIFFNICFGPGGTYPFGEDTLFIHQAFVKKARFYSLPITLADIDDGTSSWFRGFDQKHFEDRGALFAALSPKRYWLWVFQYILRHGANCRQIGIRQAIKAMARGAKSFLTTKGVRS